MSASKDDLWKQFCRRQRSRVKPSGAQALSKDEHVRTIAGELDDAQEILARPQNESLPARSLSPRFASATLYH